VTDASGDPRREPETPPDPALTRERTNISWGRSGLAVVAVTAALLRQAPRSSHAVNLLILLALVLMAIGATLALRRRFAASGDASSVERSRARVRELAVLTSLVGVLCLAVVLLGIG
jgi:predicted nucleic acid-binding Zn ribbon protein